MNGRRLSTVTAIALLGTGCAATSGARTSAADGVALGDASGEPLRLEGEALTLKWDAQEMTGSVGERDADARHPPGHAGGTRHGPQAPGRRGAAEASSATAATPASEGPAAAGRYAARGPTFSRGNGSFPGGRRRGGTPPVDARELKTPFEGSGALRLLGGGDGARHLFREGAPPAQVPVAAVTPVGAWGSMRPYSPSLRR